MLEDIIIHTRTQQNFSLKTFNHWQIDICQANLSFNNTTMNQLFYVPYS